MFRKIILGTLIAAFLQWSVGIASAQSTNPCQTISIWFFPDPIPPGWDCSLPGEGPFSMFCIVPTGACPPVAWCPTCGKFVPAVGLPINLSNGNTYIQQNDVRVPGLGGGLSLGRVWNSMWPTSQTAHQIGLFGSNWRSTYEESVFLGTGNAVNYTVYAKSDGSFWYFGGIGSTLTLVSPANIGATLTNNGTVWTMTFQTGEKRTFSFASGLLTSIVDRNGNTTQLTWDISGRLTSVADAASRHLTFTYANASYPNRITGVTSDVGIALSYSYDTQGRLTQVTKPDLTTVLFAYNTQSLITTVTDSNGKTLESHTYDSGGRGLTSVRAGGVDALSVTYH